MRKYKNKDDVQKKSYFTDRFFVAPIIPRLKVSNDEIFSKDLELLESKFAIKESYLEAGHFVFYINAHDNVSVLKTLRDDLEYDMLMELSAIDYIKERSGFEIFYEMLSMSKRKRIRVKCFIELKEELNSVIDIFKMASWSEREMYDMYGVIIINHPCMKRILMPDDWYDYPLKKTYPLQGDEAASWYEVDKIFGKEAREEIGREQRDPASIDRYDTSRFSRLGHEVPKDVEISKDNEKETSISYMEDDKPLFIKKFDPKKVKEVKRR